MKQTIKIWRMISDGNGGIGWSGFDLACAVVGIEEVAFIPELLTQIKNYKKAEGKD